MPIATPLAALDELPEATVVISAVRDDDGRVGERLDERTHCLADRRLLVARGDEDGEAISHASSCSAPERS
jgi:hypothetical protein